MWPFKSNIDKTRARQDVDGLIKALNHRNYDVRRAAAGALERIGSAQ